jgi:putative CocE/NonD family hydrolase
VAVIVPGRTSLALERDVRVPMPDGITLATDVLRPDTSAPVPALLIRTPYGRDPSSSSDMVDGLRLVEAGYAVVGQDVRGRFASEGTFRPFRDEAADGEATIAWLAEQPWCDGRVGMLGGSYVGATQWLAAARTPPALRAIAPYVTASDYHESWTYQGGAFQLGFVLRWALGSLTQAHRPTPEHKAAYDAIGTLYRRRPLTAIPELAEISPFYAEWLAHQRRDDWWRSVAPNERYEAVTVPSLNLAGWYDIFVAGSVENFRGIRARGGSAAAREGSRLIVGVWSHTNATRAYPERSYGWGAEIDELDPTTLHRRFFDRWVREDPGAASDEAPVRLFVMGVDRWSDETDWPPPDAVDRPWFLHSGGRANSAAGDGALSLDAPGDEPEDVYTADPDDPVPSIGGASLIAPGRPGWSDGPWDQAVAERRRDVLSYTSAPLQAPLGVIGSVEVVLHAASSALDTDFVARLVDVHPDGRAELLSEGILRARYRDSLAEPRPLEPDRPVELRIGVGPTANVFLPGHRVRLDIASSSFPRFDANPQSGGDPATDGPEAVVVARNRVLHDRGHPSRLVLPTVERAWEAT